MPWLRNDPPDPLEGRRKQLAAQERQLEEARRRLAESLQNDPEAAKIVEPPVWRMEEDGQTVRAADPTPTRKRHLARQRQRDMFLALLFIGVLVIVLVIVFLVAYFHNVSPAHGA